MPWSGVSTSRARRWIKYSIPDRALVGGVDASGKSIFAGRNATGFSNQEEIAVDKVKVCDAWNNKENKSLIVT